MVPWVVLAAAHARPGNVDGGFPLDEAHVLVRGVFRGNREEPVHVIGPQVPLFNATFLLAGRMHVLL